MTGTPLFKRTMNGLKKKSQHQQTIILIQTSNELDYGKKSANFFNCVFRHRFHSIWNSNEIKKTKQYLKAVFGLVFCLEHIFLLICLFLTINKSCVLSKC